MKKVFLIIGLLTLISCKEEVQKPEEIGNTEKVLEQASYNQQKTLINAQNLTDKCLEQNSINCAIDTFIKCSQDYKLPFCDSKKLPKFIFMDDAMLERPTIQEYEIVEVKKLSPTQTQVTTKSTCNGKLFDLCNGKIVYTLASKGQELYVRDLYSLGK